MPLPEVTCFILKNWVTLKKGSLEKSLFLFLRGSREIFGKLRSEKRQKSIMKIELDNIYQNNNFDKYILKGL